MRQVKKPGMNLGVKEKRRSTFEKYGLQMIQTETIYIKKLYRLQIEHTHTHIYKYT